jgi:hypothetical protein
MTVTLTATYKDTLKPETVEFIEENCIEGEYDLEDALKFIDEHNEEDFVGYYGDYIEQGENLGYDVVDAFIGEFGISEVASCEDSYAGRYDSEEDFAEEFVREVSGESIPDVCVVDWKETFERNLSYDVTVVETAYKNCRAIFVFRNWY